VPNYLPKQRNPLLGSCIALGAAAGFFLLTTIGFATQAGATSPHVHTVSVPGPVKTVTVTDTTGVSQDQFDACKAAYHQVVTILGKQTEILRGVSVAASDGFQAVADGDPSALDDAGTRVTTYTQQEQSLSGDISSVDSEACQ
jgi:hypothetical protein